MGSGWCLRLKCSPLAELYHRWMTIIFTLPSQVRPSDYQSDLDNRCVWSRYEKEGVRATWIFIMTSPVYWLWCRDHTQVRLSGLQELGREEGVSELIAHIRDIKESAGSRQLDRWRCIILRTLGMIIKFHRWPSISFSKEHAYSHRAIQTYLKNDLTSSRGRDVCVSTVPASRWKFSFVLCALSERWWFWAQLGELCLCFSAFDHSIFSRWLPVHVNDLVMWFSVHSRSTVYL